MADTPGRRSMTSSREKLSPTRPIRRSEWNRLPSNEMMPAASCPRCWRACRPSAVIAAASGWPNMPKTPHSSRSRSPSRSRPASLGVSVISLISSSISQAWSTGLVAGQFPQAGPVGRSVSGGLIGGVEARSLTRRRLILFQLRLLQPLQDGAFRVVRQHRHQPIARSLQHDPRLGAANPLGLAAVRHQPREEQEGYDDDDQPAGKPEQKAEGAVERADSAVQHHVRKPHGDDGYDQQRDQKRAGDHHRRRDDVVVEVGLRERQQLGIEIKRRHRRDQPGGDRQDLAHKAADHGEQPRNQHDADQDDVEEGDGHDRVRMLRTFRTPPVESAKKSYQPPRRPPGRQALSEDRPNLLIFLPLSASGGYERRSLRVSAVRPLYSRMRPRRHPSCWPARLPRGRPLSAPRAAMSATRLARLLTGFSDSPGSLVSSPRPPSGTTARAKPSFCASLSRVAACATGRTAPESEISPK